MRFRRYALAGLAGVGIGLSYGLLVGASAFVWWQVSSLLTDPGPMIPDNHGWGLVVVIFATLIAGVCGAIVGLVVGLSGTNKQRGAMMGAAMGLMVYLPFFVESCTGGLPKLSWPMWRDFLLASFMLLLIFPFGLALTGILASIATRKLVRAADIVALDS